jgi:hypothetical protein
VPGEELVKVAAALHDDTIQGLVVALWELNAVVDAPDLETAHTAAVQARTALEQTLARLQQLVSSLQQPA